MLTKIIFLPSNSSSYSCQRCLVLNKSNNALPNFDKEPAHDGDGDVVDEADYDEDDVGNFPILGEFWKCQRWDICLPLLFWMTGCHNDKGLTKLTKWTTILQKNYDNSGTKKIQNFPQNCDLDLWFFSVRSRSSSCSLWQGIRLRSMQTFNKQKEIVLSEKKIIVIATDPTKTLAIYIVWSQ